MRAVKHPTVVRLLIYAVGKELDQAEGITHEGGCADANRFDAVVDAVEQQSSRENATMREGPRGAGEPCFQQAATRN